MSHILLVEDDLPSRTLMEEVLQEEGYTVLTADDGVQALDLLTTIRPDLIITSLMLPKLHGQMLCTLVHANPATAGIPILICSASLERPDPEQIPHVAFLEKPFDLTTFLEVVSDAVMTSPPPLEM